MFGNIRINIQLKLIFCIIVFFLLNDKVYAGEDGSNSKVVLSLVHKSNRFYRDSLLIQNSVKPMTGCFQEPLLINSNKDYKKKSALLAIGMSAIIPGTGQFYAQKGRESLIKGASFLVAEVTGMILYLHNQNRGKKIERRYERFADENWDVDKYLYFLERKLNLQEGYLGRKAVGIEKAKLEQAEDGWGAISGVSVHHLYKNTRQQYYEMIFKYPEQFALGWFDTFYDYDDPLPDYQTGYTRFNLTSSMTRYRSMRVKSNDYLSTARGMTGVLMINHLLGIADAAWTVKRKNKEELNKISMSLRLEQKLFYNQLITMPTLRFMY